MEGGRRGLRKVKMEDEWRVRRQGQIRVIFILRSYAVGAVCLSICLFVRLSFCEQDDSRTRLRMSTKHGRHGQGVTL